MNRASLVPQHGSRRLIGASLAAFDDLLSLDDDRTLLQVYSQRQVATQSIFVRPSHIGTFNDNEPHKVGFTSIGGLYVNSEPRVVDRNVRIETVVRDVSSESRSKAVSVRGDEAFELVSLLREIAAEEGFRPRLESDANLVRSEPLAILGHLARNYFGCETILIGSAEQEIRTQN